MTTEVLDPAVAAAEAAVARICGAIDQRNSFLLEAGAGSGKTTSLTKALTHIIKTRGAELLKKNQQVACISYTNIASKVIASRVDQDPVVFASTIHSFCWLLIKDFQSQLRLELLTMPKWVERLSAIDGIGTKSIEYTLGHPSARKENSYVSLGHNDVLALAARLLRHAKFRQLMASRFPILFIDEYQDTDAEFVSALKTHVLGTPNCPLVGFFGDHWQQIYDRTCGRIEHESIIEIPQGANFRSDTAIVDVLNRMRPGLPQRTRGQSSPGLAVAYHTNDWRGQRQKGSQWKGDLPADIAHSHLQTLRAQLESEGWDFTAKKTKILMLTHNVLAQEQGYGGIAKAFSGSNSSFANKEDDYVKFFVDGLEPVCRAYERKQYGEMFLAFGAGAPTIRSHIDKTRIAKEMDKLIALRSSESVGAIIEHLSASGFPQLPEAIEEKERRFKAVPLTEDKVEQWIERLRAFRQVPYKEVIALTDFLSESTLFSTKHGVKGDEFENVLVVVGRGWNQYDFNQFLELSARPDSIPDSKVDAYERNRNLLYVAFSRAKARLAVLFTQELSEMAMSTLSRWFGEENVRATKLA